MLWRLNRIIDINGNYIDFLYDNGDRDTRIKEIKYTGHMDLANGLTTQFPYNVITFNYIVRSNPKCTL